MLDNLGLLDGFDLHDIDAARVAHLRERAAIGQASAIRQQHKINTRRANNDEQLAALLPAKIAAGDSWHVISTGDVDVLSFVRHLLTGVTHFETVSIATWRINRDDIEQIAAWLDAGRIEIFYLVIDQRFARLAPDEYERSRQIVRDYEGSTLTTCLNHSKVTLLAAPASDAWLTMESSANVNTNHRLEQTAIHNNRELHDFYADIYANVRRRRPAAAR